MVQSHVLTKAARPRNKSTLAGAIRMKAVGPTQRWKALLVPFGALSVLVVTASFFYTNCSSKFAPAPYLKISTACNTILKVTEDELHQLVEKNHLMAASTDGANGHPRCPGFFAVLEDEASEEGDSPKFSAPSTQFKATDCGEDFPSENEPVIPPPTATKDQIIRSLIARVDSAKLETTVRSMSDGSRWPTRYHASNYSRSVPEWIRSEFQRLAGSRTDIKIRLFEHTNTPMPSVEAIIPGQGPNRDKFVIIGGHQDSIHQANSRTNPNAAAPGADDNASGVAVVLETFRVLASSDYKPDATIVFYTYAAEEVGLVGSQEVARSYSSQSKTVLGAMQIDMAMFASSGTDEILFVTDFTSSTLTSLAASLAQDYLSLRVNYMTCGYACSDHASWTQRGYPSFMPAEKDVQQSIARIHTINDTVGAQTRSSYAANFAKLALAFAVSIANH